MKRFNESYVETGLSLLYFPVANPYFYAFHSSSWIIDNDDYDLPQDENCRISTESKWQSYWRLISGAGLQKKFFAHFGNYAGIGWKIYAGNGG